MQTNNIKRVKATEWAGTWPNQKDKIYSVFIKIGILTKSIR